MRTAICRKILKGLEKYTPGFLIRFQLQVLLNVTARAFDVPGKRIWYQGADQALRAYAAFTIDCMASRQAEEPQLYQEAYRTGKRVRRITGFTESRDLQQLVYYLYSNLQITMKGQLPGKITVSDCYFSRYYTPAHCRLMSSVDSGMIAGIFGGGELVFTERLTEGCGRCTACFTGGKTP